MKRALMHIACLLFFQLLRVTAGAQTWDTTDYPAWDTVVSIDDVEEDYDREQAVNFLRRNERPETGKPDRREVPEGRLEEMRSARAMWYLNIEPSKPDTLRSPKPRDAGYVPLVRRTWFQTLLWLLIIGGFAAFLMIYLSGNRVGLFRRRSEPAEAAGDPSEMPKDIFSPGYQEEINAAIARKDYRLAIRLMFLRTLKTLAGKGVIRYAQDKTNLDYLLQLHPTEFYPAFFQLTRAYEYSWYGKLAISEDGFQRIQQAFQQFDRRLE